MFPHKAAFQVRLAGHAGGVKEREHLPKCKTKDPAEGPSPVRAGTWASIKPLHLGDDRS